MMALFSPLDGRLLEFPEAVGSETVCSFALCALRIVKADAPRQGVHQGVCNESPYHQGKHQDRGWCAGRCEVVKLLKYSKVDSRLHAIRNPPA